MSATVVERVLSPEQIAAILALAERRMILVGNPERKKHRLQVPNDFPEADQIARIVLEALEDNVCFQMATYPDVCSPPRLGCYGPGMGYRDHLDQPRMGEDQVRTDLSVTISLVDADAYDGGELVIDSDRGGVSGVSWKGEAGDALVYSGDTIHRVEPVTRGARLVCIFWVQSLVRDTAKRQILSDLASGFMLAGATPRSQAGPATRSETRSDTMQRCHDSLLRMWAGR